MSLFDLFDGPVLEKTFLLFFVHLEDGTMFVQDSLPLT